MKIKKSEYFNTIRNAYLTIESRAIQGHNGILLDVYRHTDKTTGQITEMYEGKYHHIFSREWITPYGGLYSIYLYSDMEEALLFAKAMYKKTAERVTKQTILKETNTERRREYKEFLGTTAFCKLLDLEQVHEETDGYGKPMKLFKTKEEDPALKKNDATEKHLWFLMVTDTSTDREYYLCVNPQSIPKKTCSYAKESTFFNQGRNPFKLWGRQGDVGIIKLDNKETNLKTIET